MTRDGIAATLAKLAEQHKVKVPAFHYCDYSVDPSDDTSITCYRMFLQRGPSAPLGAFHDDRLGVMTFGHQVQWGDVLHEFTHHLLYLDGAKFTDNDAAHGGEFYRRLLTVISRFNDSGDVRGYPWPLEYPHLQEWARRDGLIA